VSSRDELLAHLRDLDLGRPVRVGIDGYCGAGKTTLARWLVAELGRAGRPALHVDSDGFHHVRERRYRQGRDSARGYYDDAYDLEALAERVLRPLGPGGDRTIATAVHDLATDDVLTGRTVVVPEDAVVVFAATFVQRGALRDLWDEVVWVDTDEPTATARGIARDAEALGGPEAAAAAYDARYQAACRTYVAEERPRERASIILDPEPDPSGT